MKITMLGCGASGGVPLIGCSCNICISVNSKNKRLRVSLLVENEQGKLLIDLSPDLRQQCLRNGINLVDAIIVTHGHADHCHGIDDIRAFNFHRNGALPLYCDVPTHHRLTTGFPYVFTPHPSRKPWYKPELHAHTYDPASFETFTPVPQMPVQVFPQGHGKIMSTGLKIGNFAYSTDVNNLPEESLQLIENIDLWIVDCLRYAPSPSHAHLELTLEWIARVKPKRAILTHMNHELDYDVLKAALPMHVEPGYDGMVIEL